MASFVSSDRMYPSTFNKIEESRKLKTAGENASIGYKRFSGDCRYLGKKGHKAADCFKKWDGQKNKNDGGKEKRGFQGTCHHCGKKSHKKAEYFKLQLPVI
jgi:hypothetical protein